MALVGTNFVRATRHALRLAHRYWPVPGDWFEIRSQALKLRFWDERHLHGPGLLFDLTYESMKSLSGQGVYELRVDNRVGGLTNIRIVFFDPPSAW